MPTRISVAGTRRLITSMNSEHNPQTHTAYARLVNAFKMHGSRWYEHDESYSLWSRGDVEKLLRQSDHFAERLHSDFALESTSSIVAQVLAPM